jgi:hypothetical protein
MSKLAYVVFNKDSGAIISVGNQASDTDSYIQVPQPDVLTILRGEERATNYHVQYNPKTKELEFQSKHEFTLDSTSVKDFIYELPQDSIDDADVQVIQDIPNSCWKIKLGDTLKSNIKNKGINLNARFLFSITKKGDPNILYKTLNVHIGQTVSDNYCIIPFDMPFETTSVPISVYTSRRFDTYQLTRIVNE